jgi:hypothetical protein
VSGITRVRACDLRKGDVVVRDGVDVTVKSVLVVGAVFVKYADGTQDDYSAWEAVEVRR